MTTANARTESPATPASPAFDELVDPYRRELLAHCYWMLGSIDDAEDAVQETYLRAWRAYERFEGRSSVRTWLYRIATNTCLTAARGRGRRVLPSGLGAPEVDPHAEPRPADPGTLWVQPFPDDPADVVTTRESVRLALVTAVQWLPARQRAVLLLRDVLAWPAAEVAEVLDTSVAAVKSALQRARARIDELGGVDGVGGIDLPEPDEPRRQELLRRYMTAFERSDIAMLERVLRDDATLEMPPAATWLSGKATCVPFFVASALGAPGDWRMVPISANGQPAAAAYLRGEDGGHHAYGVAVLTVAGSGIARIVAFGDPALVTRFGLASTLDQ